MESPSRIKRILLGSSESDDSQSEEWDETEGAGTNLGTLRGCGLAWLLRAGRIQFTSFHRRRKVLAASIQVTPSTEVLAICLTINRSSRLSCFWMACFVRYSFGTVTSIFGSRSILKFGLDKISELNAEVNSYNFATYIVCLLVCLFVVYFQKYYSKAREICFYKILSTTQVC